MLFHYLEHFSFSFPVGGEEGTRAFAPYTLPTLNTSKFMYSSKPFLLSDLCCYSRLGFFFRLGSFRKYWSFKYGTGHEMTKYPVTASDPMIKYWGRSL